MVNTEAIYISGPHHAAALKLVAEQKSNKKKGEKVSLRTLIEKTLEKNPDFMRYYKRVR